MMQMNALVEGAGALDTFKLCKWYADWYHSDPFDIGMTTRVGLQYCSSQKPDPQLVYQQTKVGAGATSLSNGSLMRCTPLAVWCHKLTNAEIIAAVPKDVNFTHNNSLSEQVVITYCLAIKHML
jgi:ADP-ribosyl-[dinitrogen reductase] hydrolase